MSDVFYRQPRHRYPVAVRGEGVYLYDADGRQYLDASGGAAISCLGHGHPEIIDAVQRQAERMAFAHTAFFTNEPQEVLARLLSDQFGETGARVYFLSGGSEANETALKLARQYWVAKGQGNKTVFISRRQSYHGNTLGALSVSGNIGRQKTYGAILHDWPKIAPCYAYRHRRDDEDEEAYGRRAAQALEEEILRQGADQVAAFIAETIVGATLGAVPAVEGYFREVRRICDRHGVLLILDEVMSGRGRTGAWFASEQEGIRPDIVTVAKGLGGGYQAIGAVICRGFIHDEIVSGSGFFEHGHTYIGHATACAAGLAVAGVIERDGLLARVRSLGQKVRTALGQAFENHPHVGDIRGRGLFIGIELVADRADRTPVRADLGLPGRIRDTAMQEGLICYPGGGTADGRDGAHVLLAPPFIFEDAHIDELVGKLGRTLEQQRFV